MTKILIPSKLLCNEQKNDRYRSKLFLTYKTEDFFFFILKFTVMQLKRLNINICISQSISEIKKCLCVNQRERERISNKTAAILMVHVLEGIQNHNSEFLVLCC